MNLPLITTIIFTLASIFNLGLASGNNIGISQAQFDNIEVQAQNEPPQETTFTVSTLMGTAPLSVQFSVDNVTNAEYSWSFGDGSTAVGTEVEHVFATPGPYPVVLAVSSAGKTIYKHQFVEALSQIPVQAIPPIHREEDPLSFNRANNIFNLNLIRGLGIESLLDYEQIENIGGVLAVSAPDKNAVLYSKSVFKEDGSLKSFTNDYVAVNLTTGEKYSIDDVDGSFDATGITISSDAKYIAYGNRNGEVYLYNTQTTQEKLIFETDLDYSNYFDILVPKFSPDNTELAFLADDIVSTGPGDPRDLSNLDSLASYVIRLSIDESKKTLATAEIVETIEIGTTDVHTLVWWNGKVIVLTDDTWQERLPNAK